MPDQKNPWAMQISALTGGNAPVPESRTVQTKGARNTRSAAVPKPDVLWAEMPGYELCELIAEFRAEHPEAFSAGGLSLDGRISVHEHKNWCIAVHPLCWDWLVDRLAPKPNGVPYHQLDDADVRAGLRRIGEAWVMGVICHSFIRTTDLEGALCLLQWLLDRWALPSLCPYQKQWVELGEWAHALIAVAEKKTRSDRASFDKRHKAKSQDPVTARLIRFAEQRFPDSARAKRLGNGEAKTIQAELPELGLTANAVSKRLRRYWSKKKK